MELADDDSGHGAGLPKDAVPGKDMAVISDDVVRTQGSQLPQHRLRGFSRLAHERGAVASARLSGGFDTLLTACLEALCQKASQAGESTHRKAEIDLLASQSIKVGRLAGFSPALPDDQVSERDKALEMSMRDRSVHAGDFGSIVNCPFGLVHIKVEQDPPTGPILKRADRTVDLAYLVLAHSASLSAHVGGKTDPRTHALLSRHAIEPGAACRILAVPLAALTLGSAQWATGPHGPEIWAVSSTETVYSGFEPNWGRSRAARWTIQATRSARITR